MPWRPLPQVAFAVCVYPFRASSPADLPLELGDDIYIIEQGGKDASWYRGYLVAPPSLLAGLTSTKGQTLQARVFSGIFPRNCVEVREVLGDTDAPASTTQDRTSSLRGRTSLRGEAEDHKVNGTLATPGASRKSASGSRSRQTSSKRDGQDLTSSNSRNSSRSAPIDALDFPMPPTPSATRDSKVKKPAAPVPLLKVGDETPTSAEEPLVDEISSCLREWHSTKLHELLLSRRYDVLDELSSLVQRLDTARRQLLHGVLTVQELERLRETTVWDLVHGNKLLSGEVIVRSPSEKGRVMTADDSAVEITQLQAMMSLLDEKPGQQQPDIKSLHHLLVDVRDFVGDVNQPMTLAMYLCSKTPGDKPRPVSELYTVELFERDTDSYARSSTKTKTLFVDLNNNDIGEGAGFDTSLFLVFMLMTNKPMKPAALNSMRSLSTRDSAHNANPAIPQHVSNSVGGRRSLLWGSQRGRKDSDQAMRTSEYRPTTSASTRSRLTKLQEKPPSLPEGSKEQKSVKRTVGVGALEIGSVLRGGLEIDHRVSMWAPGPSSQGQDEAEEQWDDVIKELARSPTGQYKTSNPVHRLHVFAKAFSNPDAGALVKNTPTMLHEIHQTRKIAFSGAPTKARSDIYLTLLEPFLPRRGFLSHPKSGSVPLGQDSEMANLQLTLEVRRSSGDRIEDCIYPSGNSLGHTAWRTTAVEREEGWNSTIRLAIDPEDVPGSHVVMSLADGAGFPFALSWMPLWTQEAFVPDGDHVLTLYKYDEYTSSVISGKGAYLALPPWSAKNNDESVIGPLAALHLSTYLCSTRYSQDPNLLGLLKWRDHHGSDLRNLLKRFVFVPELEIVKLLNEVFDALFAVLNEYSGSEEYEDLVFNNLVIVLGIVHDRRFDLVPLVDHYIGAQFSWPGAASCLIRGYMRLLADPVNPEASRSLRATFKVGGHVLKFIVSARYRQKEKEAGIGITSRGPAFAQELQKVFQALEALMRNPAPTLVGTKTLVVQHFHLWLPVLSEVITPREILQMAISFIDSCARAQGKLALYRLVLILHYTQLDLFNTTALRRVLAVESVRWLDPHWGFVDTVTEQWKEQVRLCCSIVASQLNDLGPENSHYVLKLVDTYTTILVAPRSKKNSFSLLFPSSYPFPTTTTAAQADVDEALVEITALLAACFNAPNSLTLDSSAIDVSEFFLNTLQVYKSVLACEAFPSSWLSVHIFHHKSAIRTLETLFSILVESYLPHPDDGNDFNSDIWQAFLDTLLKLCSSDALAMETFPEQKRRTVWKIAGDVREVGADLLRRSWEALGWETNPEEIKRYGLKKMGGYQVTYVPSMVAPIVALCMSVHAGLRKVAIEVLQSMIVSEWTLNEDLSAIQAEMIDCLDYLFKCKGVNDTLLQKLFIGELLDMFEPLARASDDALHRAVKELISTIGELLDLLIAVHSADGAGEAFRIMDTLHLMEFLRDVQKENIYIRYVHQLARVQSEAGNLTEAGQALRLHAELYDWDPSAIVEPLEDPEFPMQTCFERREQIYFLMIKHYEEKSSWDNALGAYQELATQYEHDIFDFAKLARTQRAMATIYESIAKGERQSPRYFRVVYKGLGFPTSLRDKQFIFEGTPTDRLPTFTDRMHQQHPAAKVLQPGGEEDVEGQYMQIYPVSVQKDLMHPIYQRSRVPQPIREHILLAQPKNFTTTSRRQASRDVRSNDQVVQKTVYTTQDAFPTILRRSEIVQTTKVTLTPIQAAIERTTRKTQELVALEKRVTDGLDSNLASLTDALMISVDPASENSVSRYRELLRRSRSRGGDEGTDGEDPDEEVPTDPFRNALEVALMDHALALKHCLGLYSRPAHLATRADLTERFETIFGPELDAFKPTPAQPTARSAVTSWIRAPLPAPTPASALHTAFVGPESGPNSVHPALRFTSPEGRPTGYEKTRLSLAFLTRGSLSSHHSHESQAGGGAERHDRTSPAASVVRSRSKEPRFSFLHSQTTSPVTDAAGTDSGGDGDTQKSFFEQGGGGMKKRLSLMGLGKKGNRIINTSRPSFCFAFLPLPFDKPGRPANMSNRRNANSVRGPRSALTDFLAANKISAAQIASDYETRRQRAEATAGPDNREGPSNQAQLDEDIAAAEAAAEEAVERTRKRKRNEENAIAKIKKTKAYQKKKAQKGSDNDLDGDFDNVLARNMYKKAKPPPGQLENCEICSKRFTVTPYSKDGPDGGLVCTPCGKELTADAKQEKKVAKKPAGRKRRKIESDRLDGLTVNGAKTLQQMCIEKVAQHHTDVEELGDLPQPVLERLSEIFSKKRVLNPKTLPLFLRPDLDTVAIHDCSYLEVDDYKQIFAVVPKIEKLVLRNACQFKDEAMDYMMEKAKNLRFLQLYAANLITNAMWHKLFQHQGASLETVKLQWLDASFEDEAVMEMVAHCRNITRLKFKLCRRIGEEAVAAISMLPKLEHLSLQIGREVSSERLVDLVRVVGSNLKTLSLEKFVDADDTVLEAIHAHCCNLTKFRFTENDYATDAGYAALFTDWANPPLAFADLSSTRDTDNNNPTGPAAAIGLGSAGFAALMAHSGDALERLEMASCRHVGLAALLDAFDGVKQYPRLRSVNVSFCTAVDTVVVAGMFRSCPALRRVVAFGCFAVTDVVVPSGIALIGAPRAQDAIEQIGGAHVGLIEALGAMVEVAA